MRPYTDVDRLLAEMEETESKHEERAYAEWCRMREAKRVPLTFRSLGYLIVGVLALGIAGYILSQLLFGWHF
jgi:hypothetical protein